ncbi:unnamed protein product [Rangifer tarandus platyrhynchus]|uniref:Uncharacterized protein n=2 Tax=Rangifer tarandus platyrhynchus TaxID=3082113 RepID=A0AC59Y2Z7_RANTA|nr:unnamed protein product [Rangifer tarandus platyrhynchus]
MGMTSQRDLEGHDDKLELPQGSVESHLCNCESELPTLHLIRCGEQALMPPPLLSHRGAQGLSFLPQISASSTSRPLHLENEALGQKAPPALRCSCPGTFSFISYLIDCITFSEHRSDGGQAFYEETGIPALSCRSSQCAGGQIFGVGPTAQSRP